MPLTTLERRAIDLLDNLIGEETTMGSCGPEHDFNSWRPRHKKGESYTLILAELKAVAELAAEGKL